MTPERWLAVDELLDAALARPPADRAAFLAEACAGSNVPVPERGHWAKLAAGKKVFRTKLPPRGLGESDEVTIGRDPHGYYQESEQEILEMPVPPSPVFEEDIEAALNECFDQPRTGRGEQLLAHLEAAPRRRQARRQRQRGLGVGIVERNDHAGPGLLHRASALSFVVKALVNLTQPAPAPRCAGEDRFPSRGMPGSASRTGVP